MSVYEIRALLVNDRGVSMVSTSGITTQIANPPITVIAASGTTGISLDGVGILGYDGTRFFPIRLEDPVNHNLRMALYSGTNIMVSAPSASGTTGVGLFGSGILGFDGTRFFPVRLEDPVNHNLKVALYTGGSAISTANVASGTVAAALLGMGNLGYHPGTLKWYPFTLDNEQHLRVSQKSTSFTLIASGDGAVATVSQAGTGGVSVYITSISVSYAAAGVGRITVKDGQTYIINQAVHNQRDFTFDTPLKITPGNTLEVQLTAVASTGGMIFASGYITS